MGNEGRKVHISPCECICNEDALRARTDELEGMDDDCTTVADALCLRDTEGVISFKTFDILRDRLAVMGGTEATKEINRIAAEARKNIFDICILVCRLERTSSLNNSPEQLRHGENIAQKLEAIRDELIEQGG